MSGITLWLLIVTTPSGYGRAIFSERFATRNECLAASASIQRLAKDTDGMANLYGGCVELRGVIK